MLIKTNKIKNGLRKIKELTPTFYHICYSSLIAYWYIGMAFVKSGKNFTILSNLLLMIAGISFLLVWINTKYTKKEYIAQFTLVSFLLFYFYFTGKENVGLLTIIPTFIGLKNNSIKSAVKTMFWTLSVCLFLTAILCLVNIVPVGGSIKTDRLGNSYQMITIAGQHGNTIYTTIFCLVASFLYSYSDSIKKWRKIIYPLLLAINFALFLILASRTGLIMVTFLIVGSYIFNYTKPKSNRLINLLARHSFTIFYLAVFILSTLLFNTKIYYYINDLVSSRISEAHHYFVDIGINIFPQKVEYDWICDNTQTKIIASYGIIFTIIYLILVSKTIRELENRKLKFEIFIMISFLLYSYSEVTFFKPISDFSFLFLTYGLSPYGLTSLDTYGDQYERN